MDFEQEKDKLTAEALQKMFDLLAESKVDMTADEFKDHVTNAYNAGVADEKKKAEGLVKALEVYKAHQL